MEDTITYLYVQMEFCDAGDLADYLRKRKGAKLNVERILDWTRQLCGAIKEFGFLINF